MGETKASQAADPAEANLALGCDAKASSEKNAERAAAHTVDGDPGTRWSSHYSDDQWLWVDLGSVHDLARVEVRWETAHAKTYQIQGSCDGTAWTTFASEEGHEGWVATPMPRGSSARWVR